MEALESIVQKAPTLVKVFISSRNNDDISFRFRDVQNVKVSVEDNNEDIRTFLEYQTTTNNTVRRKPLPDHLVDKIVNDILQASDGM